MLPRPWPASLRPGCRSRVATRVTAADLNEHGHARLNGMTAHSGPGSAAELWIKTGVRHLAHPVKATQARVSDPAAGRRNIAQITAGYRKGRAVVELVVDHGHRNTQAARNKIGGLHTIHTLCAYRRHMPWFCSSRTSFGYLVRAPEAQGRKGSSDAAETRCA